MVFSFLGVEMTPEQIMDNVPVNKDASGKDLGTLNQELVTWCLTQGFAVEMHTADFQLIDTSWAEMEKDKLLERMELAKTHRDVPSIGKEWSERYIQSYINFVKAGGELHIEPYMSELLINQLLSTGPLVVAVCFQVLHQTGRTKGIGLRAIEANDIEGGLTTHSVVVYGKNDAGDYLVADPWEQPGRFVFKPERLLMAMAASQIECDNVFFQLRKVQV